MPRGVDGARSAGVGVFCFPLPHASVSNHPYARHGRGFLQPIISVLVIGPAGRHPTRVVLDTGAECCLFPEWVAWRVGFRRTPSSPTVTMGSSVSRTGWSAWFETADLQLEDPAG